MVHKFRSDAICWVILALIFINAGCSTTKSTMMIDAPSGGYTLKHVKESFIQHNIDFNWVSAKAKAKIKSPSENTSGLLYLKIQKDSLVWILAKKRSAEGMRLLLEPDSIQIIYRLDQAFEKGSFVDLVQRTGMEWNFTDLQMLLSGNHLETDTSFIVQNNPEFYEIKTQPLGVKATYLIDKNSLELRKISLTDDLDRKSEITYSDYRMIKNRNIPYLRNYYLLDANNEVTEIEIELLEIQFDEPQRILFSIPSHYKEIY